MPFALFVGGGEGRWEGFEEDPPREKDREVMALSDGWCVKESEWLRLGSFMDREIDVASDESRPWLAQSPWSSVFWTLSRALEVTLMEYTIDH